MICNVYYILLRASICNIICLVFLNIPSHCERVSGLVWSLPSLRLEFAFGVFLQMSMMKLFVAVHRLQHRSVVPSFVRSVPQGSAHPFRQSTRHFRRVSNLRKNTVYLSLVSTNVGRWWWPSKLMLDFTKPAVLAVVFTRANDNNNNQNIEQIMLCCVCVLLGCRSKSAGHHFGFKNKVSNQQYRHNSIIPFVSLNI